MSGTVCMLDARRRGCAWVGRRLDFGQQCEHQSGKAAAESHREATLSSSVHVCSTVHVILATCACALMPHLTSQYCGLGPVSKAMRIISANR